MRLTTFVRNVLFALVLLLLVATIGEADFAFTRGIQEYIAFVLTTDYDYKPWLDTVRAQVGWSELTWPDFFGGNTFNSPADESGR